MMTIENPGSGRGLKAPEYTKVPDPVTRDCPNKAYYEQEWRMCGGMKLRRIMLRKPPAAEKLDIPDKVWDTLVIDPRGRKYSVDPDLFFALAMTLKSKKKG